MRPKLYSRVKRIDSKLRCTKKAAKKFSADKIGLHTKSRRPRALYKKDTCFLLHYYRIDNQVMILRFFKPLSL